jgi:hypothetical protein
MLTVLLAGMLAAQPAHECAPGHAFDYVCGLDRPEDLVALPASPWIIASGFTQGGGLRLIDRRTRSFTDWYHGAPDQLSHDRSAFPDCPGPPDRARLMTRGLHLRTLPNGAHRLYVVGHDGREAVEIFDIDRIQSANPCIRWRGCLPMPEGQVGNSVASFADGTILVTVLTRPGTTIADFVEGRSTGAVWQWNPATRRFAELAGTQLPGNNGIETDPDGRHFYVVAFGWHAVLVFDRTDTRTPVARITAVDFMPDNIRWSGGRLLIAGMRLDEPACGGLRRVIGGIADPMRCHRGTMVGEVLPAENRVATVAYARPEPAFNGASTAILVDGQLWLGSFQSDRVAIVRPTPQYGQQPSS